MLSTAVAEAVPACVQAAQVQAGKGGQEETGMRQADFWEGIAAEAVAALGWVEQQLTILPADYCGCLPLEQQLIIQLAEY